MWVARSGWSAVGRMRVCIGQARDLFVLVVAVVEAKSRLESAARCLVTVPAAARVDFHMMAVSVELEEALGNMTDVVCSGGLVGSHVAL